MLVIRVLFFSSVVSYCLFYSLTGDALAAAQFTPHRGHYFSWMAPSDWRASETMSGLTLISPSGHEAVMYAILFRSRGQATPVYFLQSMLARLPGYTNFRMHSSRQLPDQRSGIPGTSWKVIEAEMSYTVNGIPHYGVWTCGVNNYYGSYDASVNGYQAATNRWTQARPYLASMASRIAITNIRQIGGNDTLIPVQNRPLDNKGIIESGRLRDESRDRISKKTREGIMGQERMKDPATGHIYNMPLNSYDQAIGGYRNPNRPNERLVPTRPGE